MRKINPKIGEWFYEYFKNTTLGTRLFSLPTMFALFTLFAMTSACVSIEKDTQTADGQIIPGKRFLQFAEYEYICEPTLGRNHTEMEQLLDRYGIKGWKLAGFMQKDGNTSVFCMMR